MTNMFFNHFQNQLKGNQNQSYTQNMFNMDKNENPANSFNPAGFFSDPKNNVNANSSRAHATPRFDIDGTMNTGYKQTTYSVNQEGLHTTANGTHWKNGHESGKGKTRVHNNTVQLHDDQYGWCDIYAVNIDMVKEHGTGKGAVYNSKLHGSVMDVHHQDGSVTQGIILDACGAAKNKPIIDKWVYNQEKQNETVSFTVKRQGWRGPGQF